MNLDSVYGIIQKNTFVVNKGSFIHGKRKEYQNKYWCIEKEIQKHCVDFRGYFHTIAPPVSSLSANLFIIAIEIRISIISTSDNDAPRLKLFALWN